MGVIRDVLCCCFRTPNLDSRRDDGRAISGHNYVERLQNRTYQMVDMIPFEYRHMSRFKLINLLPEPEPLPAAGLVRMQTDPEYARIVASQISLDDKLRRALRLREKKSEASPEGSRRASPKKTRAPMPPIHV